MTETPAASTGWVWAPREPTVLMSRALADGRPLTHRDAYTVWPARYRAMLAAAPARVLSEDDVERVARAICNTFARDGNDYAKFAEVYKQPWRRAALAALSVDETIEGK